MKNLILIITFFMFSNIVYGNIENKSLVNDPSIEVLDQIEMNLDYSFSIEIQEFVISQEDYFAVAAIDCQELGNIVASLVTEFVDEEIGYAAGWLVYDACCKVQGDCN